MTELWDHQVQMIQGCRDQFKAGYRRPVVQAPCGSGKSRVMQEIAAGTIRRGKRVVIFTERKALREQISHTLEQADMAHGVVAAGHIPNEVWKAQVAMIQTVDSRGEDTAPDADLCIVDEADRFMTDIRRGILAKYPRVVLVTATPIGLGRFADCIVKGPTHRQLLDLGLICPIELYGGDEFDFMDLADKKAATRQVTQDLFSGLQVQSSSLVFGSILEWFEQLNPDHRPTLCWPTRVEESMWLAEHFCQAGYEFRHIDGTTDEDTREEYFAAFKAGRLMGLTSVGVMNAGVDLPVASHGILLRSCDGFRDWVQTIGRLQRKAPGKDKATLQAHTSAPLKHGSPQRDDFDWQLKFTDDTLEQLIRKTHTQGDSEPIRCPRCGHIKVQPPFNTCMACGHEHKKSVRQILQMNGKLKKVTGSLHRQPVDWTPTKGWTAVLFQAGRSGRTVKQAMGLYRRRHGQWPPWGQIADHLHCDKENSRRLVAQAFPWTKQRKGSRP